MIEGLKLTMPGETVRKLLEQRIQDHERRADWYHREQTRTPEEGKEDEPFLPEHICANEAQWHEWRAAVLGVLRDHIDSSEVYRLGEEDLALGELLPDKPGWLKQEEYEERQNGARR